MTVSLGETVPLGESDSLEESERADLLDGCLSRDGAAEGDSKIFPKTGLLSTGAKVFGGSIRMGRIRFMLVPPLAICRYLQSVFATHQPVSKKFQALLRDYGVFLGRGALTTIRFFDWNFPVIAIS